MANLLPNLTPPESTEQQITQLAKLAMGCCGQVVRVTGNSSISQRLLEMGITPGVEIRLLRAAPLGDPLEIEIRGYRLSLRRSEAKQIEIIIQPRSGM